MSFHKQLKSILCSSIHSTADHISEFAMHPEIEFTRHRKLQPDLLLLFILSLTHTSITGNLLKFFHYASDFPSHSAVVQQRAKLSPNTLLHLFQFFLHSAPKKVTALRFHGYQLLACDGSDVNTPRNSRDSLSFFHSPKQPNGYNIYHVNALYDLMNHVYTDMIIQPRRANNERNECIRMMERNPVPTRSIIIADRGYESYKFLAHFQEAGQLFLLRAQDISGANILHSLPDFPQKKTFDIPYTITLTRSRNIYNTTPGTCRCLSHTHSFDLLDETRATFLLTIRIVRLYIKESDTYECLITNLPRKQFSAIQLKELYRLRWGIETSFRKLKYTVGLASFHSIKPASIMQEIFASFILYNFSEMIIMQTLIAHKDIRYEYQVNFSNAVQICRELLFLPRGAKTPDVTALLTRLVILIRPGRSNDRNIKAQSAYDFRYRIA
jgi:hypothetical protein